MSKVQAVKSRELWGTAISGLIALGAIATEVQNQGLDYVLKAVAGAGVVGTVAAGVAGTAKESGLTLKGTKSKTPLDYALELAIPEIKVSEGLELNAYLDSVGVVTIGYGSTLTPKGEPWVMGDRITEQQAEKMLLDECKSLFNHLSTTSPHWVEMAAAQQACLLSFAYNLGPNFYGADGFDTISRCLCERDWMAVPRALELYCKTGEQVLAGLLARRKREASLWIDGLARLGIQQDKIVAHSGVIAKSLGIWCRLTWNGDRDENGFRRFKLELMNGSKPVDSLSVLSGALSRQYEPFVWPHEDFAGSNRPLPEGCYEIGQVERGFWGGGIGNVWADIVATGESEGINNRGDFGFHQDWNIKSSKGSAGCLVTYDRPGIERIAKWISSAARPEKLIVDYGLGWLRGHGYDHYV
ncbi:MAG: lysozyme [Cyanobacteria bacterium P01_H01_bin.121]